MLRASLEAQMVKNLPAMQETRIGSLGLEDPLEEGVDTHSSILAQRIPWTEELGGLQSMGSQRVTHYQATCTFHFKGMIKIKRTRERWLKSQLFQLKGERIKK